MKKEKTNKKNQIDMLHGPMLKKLLVFALPLAATSMLQQLFNSTDVAVVGKFSGSDALAAVGSTSSLIVLLINLFVGLSVGANVVIATYIGRGTEKEISGALHTSICVAAIGGAVMTVIGVFLAKPLLMLMGCPDDILPLAVLYMKIFFLGMPFSMIYNFGASILRSKGDSKRPLYCLLVSGTANVGLNLLLVIVFDLSVAGVAIATVTANIINCVMMTFILTHEEGDFRLRFKELRIEKDHLVRILKIGIPSGIQGMVFSFSNVCIQTALNSMGPSVIAGSAAAVNLEFFSFFIINAFVQTCTTFTGQNFGARRYDRCDKVIVRCMSIAIIADMCFIALCIVLREPVIHLFTTDPVVAGYAYDRMFHILIFAPIAATYEVSGGALRGMGHSMTPSVITIFGTCIVRIGWAYAVLKYSLGYVNLLMAYPVTWVITGTGVVTAYFIVRKREYGKKSSSI